MKRIISPSILSANFLELGKDIKMLNESEAEWIHYDVMDGVFVPNISFGIDILSQVNKVASKLLDVHLMIADPNPYLELFYKAGAGNITVHFETCNDLSKTISEIKKFGIMASVSIKPNTPIDVLTDLLPKIDMVLIMSVEPGFGGQKFIPSTLDKTLTLRNEIDKRNLKTLIQVDGGINYETGKQSFENGVNSLVAGSFIFGSESPKSTIHKLLNL